MIGRRLLALAAVVTAVVGAYLARGLVAGPEPEQFAAAGVKYAVTVRFDRLGTGVVDADVVVRGPSQDVRGQPQDKASAGGTVSLFAVMPSMGHVMPEVPARREGPNRFAARGELFAMPGIWRLTVRVRGTPGAEDLSVDVAIP